MYPETEEEYNKMNKWRAESNSAPEFIYLQMDGDGGDEYIENRATWAEERIYDSDVKYKRV